MSVFIYIVVLSSSEKNKLSTFSVIGLAPFSAASHPENQGDKPISKCYGCVIGKPAELKRSALVSPQLFSQVTSPW